MMPIGTMLSAEQPPRTTVVNLLASLTSMSNDENDDDLYADIAPATSSLDGVRRLARLHVYKTYPCKSRGFGPFLPIDGYSSMPGRRMVSLPTMRKIMEEGQPLIGAPPVPSL